MAPMPGPIWVKVTGSHRRLHLPQHLRAALRAHGKAPNWPCHARQQIDRPYGLTAHAAGPSLPCACRQRRARPARRHLDHCLGPNPGPPQRLRLPQHLQAAPCARGQARGGQQGARVLRHHARAGRDLHKRGRRVLQRRALLQRGLQRACRRPHGFRASGALAVMAQLAHVKPALAGRARMLRQDVRSQQDLRKCEHGRRVLEHHATPAAYRFSACWRPHRLKTQGAMGSWRDEPRVCCTVSLSPLVAGREGSATRRL